MKKGVKYLSSALATVLCLAISLVGTYTTVEATQLLEEATNQTKSGVVEDVSEFLGNYTMIGSDGTISTIPEDQMQEILDQGSDVIEKTLVKEVAKKQLSRETLANLEKSIYEIIDLTMKDSDITDTELSLLKSSVASIIEQNVLDITSEYYEVSERNIEILETSINNKIKVIEEILNGYDERLTDLQTDLDTLTINVQEAEKRDDMSKEEIDALQKEVSNIVSELTNLQLKYESYTLSSVATTMLVDGIYDGNRETLEYATKQALENSNARTEEKITALKQLIGEWDKNVTLAQAIENAMQAIEDNSSDVEGKLKNLQTIFELEIASNKALTDKDIKDLKAVTSALQESINSFSSPDVEALSTQKLEFEQKLAENANADAQTRTVLLNQINELNERIKSVTGLGDVSEELETLVNGASEELSLVLDTKIQTLQAQLNESIAELESALGSWNEDTTIAEFLIAAKNAIDTNAEDQTELLNAAKAALELQILNNKTKTEEQKEQFDEAIAALNIALSTETDNRQHALDEANSALTAMIDESNDSLAALFNEEINALEQASNQSFDALKAILGDWDEHTTIAEYLVAAQNAIETNDENQTQLLNAAKTALELQIANSTEEISQEQRELLDDAVATFNDALLAESSQREEALQQANDTLIAMIDESNDDLSNLINEEIDALATRSNETFNELKNVLGEWNENTTIAEYLIAARNAIESNDENQTNMINAAKSALELQIANSAEDISEEQRTLLDNAVATLNAALEAESFDREQALSNVSTTLENMITESNANLSALINEEISTLTAASNQSFDELKSVLGDWEEQTTIAEYLIAARDAIVTNDANQTNMLNAAKTALELQITNSAESISEEQRGLLDNAVATLNAALSAETSDRQQALAEANAALEDMITQSQSDLTGLMNDKVGDLTTTLNTSVNSINSDIDSINTTIGSWNETGSIADAIRDAQANNSLLSEQLSDTNSDLQDTISSLNTTQSSLTATQNSLTNTNTLLSKVQSIVATDGELSGSYTGTLISRMAVSEGLISSMQSDLSNTSSDVSNLQTAVSQLQTSISDLQNSVNSNAQAITDIQSMLGDQVTFTVVDGVLYINTK